MIVVRRSTSSGLFGVDERPVAVVLCDDAPVILKPVMCAFCAEGVEETELDPCALVVIAGWAGSEDQQSEQQFFSHAECLRTRLHPDVAVHAEILAPDAS